MTGKWLLLCMCLCAHILVSSGESRLTSGDHGTVEVYHDDQWGTICDDRWSVEDVMVVCQEHGFSFGVATKEGTFSESNADIMWLDEVQCSGNETSLNHCSHSRWGSHDCHTDETAGVFCYDSCPDSNAAVEGVVRMTGTIPGLVEVYHQCHWGAICDSDWDDHDAQVVCTQMGHSHGRARGGLDLDGERLSFVLDGVQCDGEEQTISECTHFGWGNHWCGPNNVAGVYCYNDCSQGQDTGTEGGIRLQGNATASGQGVVEIYSQGCWLPICDTLWTNTDAEVVCRQLGYTYGMVQSTINYDIASTAVWSGGISCNGNEANLSKCYHDPWVQLQCNMENIAAVTCGEVNPFCSPTEDKPENPVRIQGGTQTEGALQVYHQGCWGYICRDLWTDTAAEVACRQLGYDFGKMTTVNLAVDPQRLSVDYVICGGSESSVSECITDGWDTGTCLSNKAAGVICSQDPVFCSSRFDPPLEGAVRLLGGNEEQGLVEVYHAGCWGLVCDTGWDDIDAQVACKQLGLESGVAYTDSKPSGFIWMDGLSCTGEETSLVDCPDFGWNSYICDMSLVSGVQCENITKAFQLPDNGTTVPFTPAPTPTVAPEVTPSPTVTPGDMQSTSAPSTTVTPREKSNTSPVDEETLEPAQVTSPSAYKTTTSASTEGVPPSPCDTFPCKNGGTCTPAEDTYICDCPSNYNYTNCDPVLTASLKPFNTMPVIIAVPIVSAVIILAIIIALAVTGKKRQQQEDFADNATAGPSGPLEIIGNRTPIRRQSIESFLDIRHGAMVFPFNSDNASNRSLSVVRDSNRQDAGSSQASEFGTRKAFQSLI